MKRFYSDDENQEPFFNSNEEEENDLEPSSIIDKQSFLEVMRMELAQKELNQRLIEQATLIAERQWFWRFRGADYKIEQIARIYISLMKILEINLNEPEENE